MNGDDVESEVAQYFSDLWRAIHSSERPQDLIDRIRDALDRKADTLARQQPTFIEGSFTVLSVAHQTESTLILKVRHRDLGRSFAIKTMPEDQRGDASLEQRLRREAEIGMELRHPCLQEVSALLRLTDGRPGLLQPWAPISLASRLSAEPPSAADIKHLLRRMVHAIAAVHAAGYVHCDISPANILLSADNLSSARLSDFGIALKIGERHADIGVEVAGSPDYAAPEQLSDMPAHPHQDIYALGRLTQRLLDAGGIDDDETLTRFAKTCADGDAAKRPQSAGEALRILL
ncbi:protein kinase [Agrobacterium vaccinii]|uniref:protein kinase domain-containing protein n=1 Tax=Agrobacterium vaccinii TaxID=2735528 RepID=UPI001E2C7B62|nr:protein kinase [Agrobacterium vaccinii]UHS64075.1 protein kinase [Agrobacterium vaccinii]